MKFEIFTNETRQQWMDTGYNYVKLSSEDIFTENRSGETLRL